MIPEVGLAGQQRLLSSRVLCIGAGGLGSPVLAYLAAAGVGRLGIIDDDVVDETNLQRQTLFSTADVGRRKAEVAAERVVAANPGISVDALTRRFDESNARELVRLYDVVVDCTDRFSTRYLINDACVLERKPEVFGSIYRFDGHVTVFPAGGRPCYRCLFPQAPPPDSVPSCAEGGVLGAIAGIVGTFQANEALKLLLGIGEPLYGRLLTVDALLSSSRVLAYQRDPECVACGDAPEIDDAREYRENEVVIDVDEIGPEELERALAQATLLDVREPHEAVLGVQADALHVPASQLEARMHELDSATTYVVACRLGRKSLWAIARLRDAGFDRLLHLRGGLLAYAAMNEDFTAF